MSYCPNCKTQLNGVDDDQLCFYCGWFGDKIELLPERKDHEVVENFHGLLNQYAHAVINQVATYSIGHFSDAPAEDSEKMLKSSEVYAAQIPFLREHLLTYVRELNMDAQHFRELASGQGE